MVLIVFASRLNGHDTIEQNFNRSCEINKSASR
jgi:hypothetical protein